MRAQFYRGSVVWHNKNPAIISCVKGIEDVTNNHMVETLYSGNFFAQVAVMACFIRRLNMKKYEILVFQGINRSVAFPFIICVIIAGCTRDIYNIKTKV